MLSHGDLIPFFKKSINSDVDFGIYYDFSNNKNRLGDI